MMRSQFKLPRDIGLDSARNRVLVTDEDLRAVISVDLTTGERTILSAPTTPNTNDLLAVVGARIKLNVDGNEAIIFL